MRERTLLAVFGALCLPLSAGPPTPTPKPGLQVQQPLKAGYSINLVVQGPGKVEMEPAPPDPAHPFFDPNTYVLFTARPGPNGQFDEWGGLCAGQGQSCQFTVKSGGTVSVAFKPKKTVVKYRITVDVTGNVGSARLTSEPSGILCGKGNTGMCSAEFVSQSSMYLMSQGTGAYKVDWTVPGVGGLINPEKQQVFVDRDQTVTVKFTKTRDLPDTVHVPDTIVMTGNKALEDSLK